MTPQETYARAIFDELVNRNAIEDTEENYRKCGILAHIIHDEGYRNITNLVDFGKFLSENCHDWDIYDADGVTIGLLMLITALHEENKELRSALNYASSKR